MTAPIDLTDEQWRDRAFVLDALRTRLGELETEARIGTYEDQQRARQAVEDFVAALFDRTRRAESAAARLDWLVMEGHVPSLRRTKTGWRLDEESEDYIIVSEGDTYTAVIDKARTVPR